MSTEHRPEWYVIANIPDAYAATEQEKDLLCQIKEKALAVFETRLTIRNLKQKTEKLPDRTDGKRTEKLFLENRILLLEEINDQRITELELLSESPLMKNVISKYWSVPKDGDLIQEPKKQIVAPPASTASHPQLIQQQKTQPPKGKPAQAVSKKIVKESKGKSSQYSSLAKAAIPWEVIAFIALFVILYFVGNISNYVYLFLLFGICPLVIALTGCISCINSRNIEIDTLNEETKNELSLLNKKKETEINLKVREINSLEWRNNTLRKEKDAEINSKEKIIQSLEEQNNTLRAEIQKENTEKNEYVAFVEKCKSNLTAFPYMAGIIAEIETHGYDVIAEHLNWGQDKTRLKKVASIKEIKHDAKQRIKHAKQAEYQLQYLMSLYPSLEELLDIEFSKLPNINASDLEERDHARDYLSKEEWAKLSVAERNQRALDRYIASHSKTKWQIGRDYEEYVAHIYRRKGYEVDTFGAYMGVEDLGRDLIAKKGKAVYIIQCKYWSAKKIIHEKHINQLFGTMTSYAIEHENESVDVHGVFVTNISLSDTAQKFSKRLKIEVTEKLEIKNFPRIKCNIGRDGAKIYHLPFDQQYDSTRIDKPGEFYAMSVSEAERAGFRRAFKWHGNKL